jgi:hypothetical protein
MYGEHFSTSPNQFFIPVPPVGDCQVFLRRDANLGPDDPTLYPQSLLEQFCHFVAIPKKPTPQSSPYHSESYMWDHHVTSSDFQHGAPGSRRPCSQEPLPDESVDTKAKVLGRQLHKTAQTAFPFEKEDIKHRKPLEDLANVLVTLMRSAMQQLESTPHTISEATLYAAVLRRSWLELCGLIDYMTIFKPRMDSLWQEPPVEAENRMGAFTNSAHMAGLLFKAGLPVFVCRPTTDLANQNVHRSGELSLPTNLGIEIRPLHVPPDILYEGSSN